MIALPPGARDYLAYGRTDIRHSCTELATQVQTKLGRDPYDGASFIFRGSPGDLVKAIWRNDRGIRRFAKRLKRGRFIWPAAKDGAVRFSAAEFLMLLDAIDGRNTNRNWRPDVAA